MRLVLVAALLLCAGCITASKEAALEARFKALERRDIELGARVDRNTSEIHLHAGELGRVTGELGRNGENLGDLTERVRGWIDRQEAKEAVDAEIRRREAEAAAAAKGSRGVR